MFGADVFVLEFGGVLDRSLEDSPERIRHARGRESGAAHLREFLHQFVQLDLDEVQVRARLLQNRHGSSGCVLHEGGQDMFGFDHLVAIAAGNLLGGLHCFLRLDRELVEIQDSFLSVPS
jgi:hypothetical protein